MYLCPHLCKCHSSRSLAGQVILQVILQVVLSGDTTGNTAGNTMSEVVSEQQVHSHASRMPILLHTDTRELFEIGWLKRSQVLLVHSISRRIQSQCLSTMVYADAYVSSRYLMMSELSNIATFWLGSCIDELPPVTELFA